MFIALFASHSNLWTIVHSTYVTPEFCATVCHFVNVACHASVALHENGSMAPCTDLRLFMSVVNIIFLSTSWAQNGFNLNLNRFSLWAMRILGSTHSKTAMDVPVCAATWWLLWLSAISRTEHGPLYRRVMRNPVEEIYGKLTALAQRGK